MSSESSEYSSSSEEEEETVFHKPVLLTNTKTAACEQSTKNDEVRNQSVKRSIEAANKLAVEKEELQRQTELNYSATDKDLLRRTMELDDDDSVDPENEYKLWLNRQESRKSRQRELLVKKQLELERDEVNRIKHQGEDI